MQSEESMQSHKFNINTVQLPGYLSNSKKVKWSPYCSRTTCFELIAHPATLSARYAVCSVQIKFGDLAEATCSSHLDLYLPALQVQVVCT